MMHRCGPTDLRIFLAGGGLCNHSRNRKKLDDHNTGFELHSLVRQLEVVIARLYVSIPSLFIPSAQQLPLKTSKMASDSVYALLGLLIRKRDAHTS